MGEVYAAEDVVSDRMVALKVMRRNTEDPAAPERFLREAQALARVRSPHVVRIYDFDRDMDRGLLFVAMELAPGDDLNLLLAHGRLPPALALRVMEDVARGLAAAHDVGIIHRDLKPANLKLKPEKEGIVRVKLLDFGLVRDRESSASLTDLGKAPGTLSYMSPEILNEEKPDERSDLYSLGVIAYEMLAGRPPFRGKSRIEIAIKHLREQPKSIERMVPEELPDDLGDLIHAMLVKDPENRIADTGDVIVRVAAIREANGLEFRVDHQGKSDDPFADWGLLAHVPDEQDGDEADADDI